MTLIQRLRQWWHNLWADEFHKVYWPMRSVAQRMQDLSDFHRMHLRNGLAVHHVHEWKAVFRWAPARTEFIVMGPWQGMEIKFPAVWKRRGVKCIHCGMKL